MTNFTALGCNMIAYGANQFAVNTLQGTGMAHSGTSTKAQNLTYGQAFGHIAAFSAANALGEVADAVVYTGLVAFFNKISDAIHGDIARRNQTRLKNLQELRFKVGLRIPRGGRYLDKSYKRIPAASFAVRRAIHVIGCDDQDRAKVEPEFEEQRDSAQCRCRGVPRSPVRSVRGRYRNFSTASATGGQPSIVVWPGHFVETVKKVPNSHLYLQ
ncbi:hypothetical protein [Ensifer adhaerens]